MTDEIEYRYVKGKGWVAGYENKPRTCTLAMPYAYVLEPGMMVSGPNGIVGRIISYENGLATIVLTDTSFNGTVYV